MTYIVVTVEDHQQRAHRRRHEEQSAVCENVVPEPTGPVFPANLVHVSLRAPVERAQVQVAADVILRPVARIRVEDAVDDKICEGEEEGGDSSRMGHKLVAFEERVEYKFR